MTNWMGMLMASSALLPVAANAQATVEAGSNDIVVTAQRYEQRLQDVPLSITAVSADQIKARAAGTINDLQYSIPGLSIFSYGPGENFTQLRGVSNSNGSATVGLYFDETPISLDQQGSDIAPQLIDMERIEVLRGPQATLYGQSSMGGTIRYLPATPRLDRVTGSADAQLTSTKDGSMGYKLDAALNLPIVADKLGLRIAGGYERVGGWIDSLATGARDINKGRNYTARGILRLKPVERLDIQILGLYQKSTQGNQNFGVDRKTSAAVATPIDDRTSLIQGKAAYELDFATLSGSASYIDRRLTNSYDVSSFYLPVLALFGLPPGYITSLSLGGNQHFRIFNSELRLASQGKGPLTWAIGATFRDLKAGGSAGIASAPNPLPFVFLQSLSGSENKSFAVYGEAGYAIIEKLKATVGVRYYHEEKNLDATNTQFGVSTLDAGRGRFHSVNPRFNLSYDVSRDAMVYVNVAKGFRSGGFNNTSAGAGIFAVPPTYQPDEIWTYEAGTKHILFAGKLILDGSVYRSIWAKVQSTTFVPGSALAVVTNSGRVEGWGVDASATARPVKDLILSATLGWNNLHFTTSTADKLAGDPVDSAIRLSYSASLDYRPALTDTINALFRIDYQHAGKGTIISRNFTPPVFTLRPKRDLVGLRLGVDIGPSEIAVFADNLFDEKAPNIVGPSGPIAENLEQRPRVIGISASTKF